MRRRLLHSLMLIAWCLPAACAWAGEIHDAVGRGDAAKVTALLKSTPALKAALTTGLVAAGSHVLDIGVLPTSAFYFAKDHRATHLSATRS